MTRLSQLVVLLVWASAAMAVMDEPPADMLDGEEQMRNEPPKQKGKMAPEAQRVTLESVSAECFDPVYAVINGEAEQNSLSETCMKEMTDGYNISPLGQLQSKEMMSAQTAAILRLSSTCRAEFIKAAQPKEGEEAVQPSESCVEDFQKQYREMNQWISAATLAKLSAECKKEAQSGSLSAECEAEFIAVKPQIIQTLDTQNEQKAKEPPKEEKKKKNTTSSGETKKRVKPSPPLIDPSLLFFVFWSLVIGGTIGYTCYRYHQEPESFVSAAPVAAVEPEKKSKTQMKKEARSSKGRRS